MFGYCCSVSLADYEQVNVNWVITKDQETPGKRRIDAIKLFLVNIKTNIKFIKILVNKFDVKSIHFRKNTTTTKRKLNK